MTETSQRPVAVTVDGGTLTCRTIIPAGQWDNPRQRDAVWDKLRGDFEAEAVRREVTFAGDPVKTYRYIRFFTEKGVLKCDTGATEWTATDVWLQLQVGIKTP